MRVEGNALRVLYIMIYRDPSELAGVTAVILVDCSVIIENLILSVGTKIAA
jgi:hypothetical protein